MRVPRHWARASTETRTPQGRSFSISLWRASERSRQDALLLAREAVERMAVLVRLGEPLPRAYGYSDRPLREEIVQEMADERGEVRALLTRNSYGALVLNTAAVMFIDVDAPGEGWLARLRRRARGWLGRPIPSPTERVEGEVRAWCRAHPELGIRLYQTAAGFRLLVTSRTYDPASDQSVDLLRSAGADPLYIRLCQAQQCFRARLSPKAWRCGVPAPPTRFPWEAAEQERRYRQWQQRYEQQCEPYATCRLLEQFGPGAVAAEVKPVLGVHDRLSRATEPLPLA